MFGYIEASFNTADIVSGSVTSGDLGVGVVNSGSIASGAIIGTAGVGVYCIASGTIGTSDIANAAIVSGLIGSGQIGRYHLNSGTVVDFIACEQDISGAIAVAWGSGGCFVVPAERRSGLRLPAIGVAVGNYASGSVVAVVRRGMVGVSFSGGIASGQYGRYAYVGSGGLIVNLSGYMAGASSGTGPNPVLNTGEISGSMVCRIGRFISGGLDVCVGDLSSGLVSGLLGQF